MKPIVAISICAFFLSTSCALLKDKSDDSSDSTPVSTFKDTLTVGSGANYQNFTLVGSGSTLYPTIMPMMVFWRLESSADMAGSQGKLILEKSSVGGFALEATLTAPNPQNYGHILISSFQIHTKGSYRLIGSLITPPRTIDTCFFEVK